MVKLSKLPGPHRTCSDISDLAAFDEVVKGFHRFFRCGVGVIAVNLQEVDVRSLKTFERGVYSIEDRLSRKTGLVDILPGILEVREPDCAHPDILMDQTIAFSENKDFLSRDVILFESMSVRVMRAQGTHLLNELPGDTLRLAV